MAKGGQANGPALEVVLELGDSTNFRRSEIRPSPPIAMLESIESSGRTKPSEAQSAGMGRGAGAFLPFGVRAEFVVDQDHFRRDCFRTVQAVVLSELRDHALKLRLILGDEANFIAITQEQPGYRHPRVKIAPARLHRVEIFHLGNSSLWKSK